MKPTILLLAALTLGPVGVAQAKDKVPGIAFEKHTPVVVIGEITSPPKSTLGEEKMQVAIGPRGIDYTLHFDNAEILGTNGRWLDQEDLDDGMWVRAEGRMMSNPRRIKVTRMQVIAKDREQFSRTAYFNPGQEHGFITSVAGSRQVYPPLPGGSRATPVSLIGRVSESASAVGPMRTIQVMSAGNAWSLDVPDDTLVVDARGEKLSVPEIRTGQWVRIQGWRTDDLRLQATRIESIGRDEALRASGYYRTGTPLGYAEIVPELGLVRKTVTGTVAETNLAGGYIAVVAPNQQRVMVWVPSAEIKVKNRTVRADELKPGDVVDIAIFTFK